MEKCYENRTLYDIQIISKQPVATESETGQ